MSITFGGLLFLVFLVLKLTHVIDWAWWLVTLPLWAGFVLALPFFILAALVGKKANDNIKTVRRKL